MWTGSGKTTKKSFQDIFPQGRNLNPKSLAYTAVIHFLMLMFGRYGNNQTIAVGERNRGHTCYEHSIVDSRIIPCIYTLEYSSCEEERVQLVCCQKY